MSVLLDIVSANIDIFPSSLIPILSTFRWHLVFNLLVDLGIDIWWVRFFIYLTNGSDPKGPGRTAKSTSFFRPPHNIRVTRNRLNPALIDVYSMVTRPRIA